MLVLPICWLPLKPQAEGDGKGKTREDSIVTEGQAPNGRFSIAALSETSDSAADGFYKNLYLMAEPSHRKMGLLEEVQARRQYKPGYHARWSVDSRYVAIRYSVSTRFCHLVLYRVGNNRTFPISLPNLETVAGKFPKSPFQEYLHDTTATLKWLSPHRFRLVQNVGFSFVPQQTAERLNRFYQRKMGDSGDTITVLFGAEAVCELTSGNKCRIISLKPTKVYFPE